MLRLLGPTLFSIALIGFAGCKEADTHDNGIFTDDEVTDLGADTGPRDVAQLPDSSPDLNAPDMAATDVATDAALDLFSDSGDSGDIGDSDVDEGMDASADADADASVDAGPENECQAVGGICLGSGTACTDAGGTLLPAGDAGCVFSDGQGACCAPPVANPTGDSCLDHGGLCAPIAGCNFVEGAFTPSMPLCNDPFQLCCVTGYVCGNEDVMCCDLAGPTGYRAACDRGTFTCNHIPDTTLVPVGMCPP